MTTYRCNECDHSYEKEQVVKINKSRKMNGYYLCTECFAEIIADGDELELIDGNYFEKEVKPYKPPLGAKPKSIFRTDIKDYYEKMLMLRKKELAGAIHRAMDIKDSKHSHIILWCEELIEIAHNPQQYIIDTLFYMKGEDDK